MSDIGHISTLSRAHNFFFFLLCVCGGGGGGGGGGLGGWGGGAGGGGYDPFKNITHISSNRSFIKGGRKQKNTGKRAHNLVPVSCALSLCLTYHKRTYY